MAVLSDNRDCRTDKNSPSARTQQVLPLFKIMQLTCTASVESYWSQTLGSRLCPSETTAKVKCKHYSQ